MPVWLSGPLLKYGGLALALAAMCGIAFYQGLRFKQQEWDAAIMLQAMETGEEIIRQSEQTAELQAKVIEQERLVEVLKRKVHNKVVIYAESTNQKCLLSPEFERAYNAIRSLLDTGSDGLSAAASAPGDADAPSRPAPTDAAVLRALQDAVEQLRELRDKYVALRDWVQASYDMAREARE